MMLDGVASARTAVVLETVTWLRTPFHPGANLKGVGCSCAHWLPAVYRAAGVEVPDIEIGKFAVDWHLHEDTERFLAIVERYLHAISGPPAPGDLACYKFGRVYGHAAIVVDWPLVVHAHWSNGVEYARGDQPPLLGQPVKFYSPWSVA